MNKLILTINGLVGNSKQAVAKATDQKVARMAQLKLHRAQVAQAIVSGKTGFAELAKVVYGDTFKVTPDTMSKYLGIRNTALAVNAALAEAGEDMEKASASVKALLEDGRKHNQGRPPKVTDEVAAALQAARNEGKSLKVLAQEFGLSVATVRKAL